MKFALLVKNFRKYVRSSIQIAKRDLVKLPIMDFYGSSHSRRVLITYVSKSFRSKLDISHTSNRDVIEIANVFNHLGFNVDIVDYNYDGEIDYNRYNVIFGFGDPLIKSFYNRRKPLVTIYYGTGMHIETQNANTLKRIEEVFQNKQKWLPGSGRIVEQAWSVQTTLVTALILLGNELVRQSYAKYFSKNIFLIPPPYFKVVEYDEILEKKNFADARIHFLWFGSSGLIHKGLDILLEVFADRPELNLHICGPITGEPEFCRVFHKELFGTKNIFNHGFTPIDSPLFRQLLETCAFTIFPSCSEGGGVSVLNVLGNGGLVPLLSKEASIDIDDFGIQINALSADGVTAAINSALQLDVDEIKLRSRKAAEKVNLVNSVENYRRHLTNSLEQILKQNEL